jgi:hypothetical protein
MTGYADLVPLRTTAEAARELAEHTGLPADIQAAEEADAALEAALAPTVGQLDSGVPLLLLGTNRDPVLGPRRRHRTAGPGLPRGRYRRARAISFRIRSRVRAGVLDVEVDRVG